MEARVRRFVQGFRPLVINEAATAALNFDMNYGKMVLFSQATETRKLKNMMERQGSSKGSKGPHQQGRLGGRLQQQRRPPCPKCARMHLEISYIDVPVCYGCGMRGHIQRECRVSRQCTGRGTAQPSISTAAISPAPPPARGSPAPAGRGATRDGA
ncbi:PREDICTED: uncharacterized protein LOC109237166 [Nicotiana attenuata]|uniref:uncharacterized protein LOC109237166 n=1 Tax=Nicotiana attenuata TaxID=49451 RepID=UPI000905D326|nr:PREDICTED: uncharacterized protein LOC109237166 [Nicotiana attenuata]